MNEPTMKSTNHPIQPENQPTNREINQPIKESTNQSMTEDANRRIAKRASATVPLRLTPLSTSSSSYNFCFSSSLRKGIFEESIRIAVMITILFELND
uniref:Uncharacterized protein n=1 Tax=Romanomermis culicivorax TaxID=13658 RepID=A0A915ICW8_ROMCU